MDAAGKLDDSDHIEVSAMAMNMTRPNSSVPAMTRPKDLRSAT
jgi:hypothetical protein